MRVHNLAKLSVMGILAIGTVALLGCHHDTVGTTSGVGGPVGQPGANGLDNGPGSNGTGAGNPDSGNMGSGGGR